MLHTYDQNCLRFSTIFRNFHKSNDYCIHKYIAVFWIKNFRRNNFLGHNIGPGQHWLRHDKSNIKGKMEIKGLRGYNLLLWLALHTVRVTRLGDFSPDRRLITLGNYIFWKLQKVAHVLGPLFRLLRLCINFDKKCLGLNFGRFFHKLIWSPCLSHKT
jgi:hypothetical protein